MLQRVLRASVSVDGVVVGSIAHGLVALIGIEPDDTAADAEWLAAKTARARLFASPERDFDRSLRDVGGGLLCVSQFTLFADLRRGNRPSWQGAADASAAEPLVAAFARAGEAEGLRVARGVFGERMEVSLVGDGPVTLVIDSAATRERSRPSQGPGC